MALFGSLFSAEPVKDSRLENLCLENSLRPPISSIRSSSPELTTLSNKASLYFLSN
jgi:hypothetical protein